MATKQCVVGYYFTTEEILEAARKAKQRGFEKFDTFTPFAVHGMEEAMGIKRSWLPYVSFGAGAFGFGNACLLTIWTHYFSWPLNVGGKPLLAIPAYIPVMFELTVLFAGVVSALFMFTYLLKLPNYKRPIFHPDITCHRFAVAVEVDRIEEAEPVKRFLQDIQAKDVHVMEGAL